MTKSILRFGSTPRATMSSSSSVTTVEFSVAPSRMPSTCLLPSHIHAHRADHGVVAEDEPVDVDHQQLQVVEAPREQRFDLGLGGLDHPPAHR